MSQLIYQLFCWAYPLLIGLAAPFHPKARSWVRGRKGIFEKLEPLRSEGPFIWMHCASLGEFEQGRPVLEAMRTHYPTHKILLTFFSPSGYENLKDYSGADHVHYLPMDGPRHAKRFIEIVNPKLVVFVKYEFWFYYLKKLQYRNIPLLLVSAYFRSDMSFFRWYGGLSRKMLTRFRQIFVQDPQSYQLLQRIGLTHNVRIGGDTRFDRVLEVAKQTHPIAGLEKLANDHPVIVVGSSWPADEELWSVMMPWLRQQGIKLIVVPHEITEPHLNSISGLFPSAQRYSSIEAGAAYDSDVLIVDRVGLLARLYRLGWVNYVGGGLNSGGVHNVLEAAVYSRPVICGPYIEKYREAVELKELNGLITLPKKDPTIELSTRLQSWAMDPKSADRIGEQAGKYVREQAGAVKRILDYVDENRLLTN